MIVINDQWRITADRHQWIVQRNRGVAKKDHRGRAGAKKGDALWENRAYFKDLGDAAIHIAAGHIREKRT